MHLPRLSLTIVLLLGCSWPILAAQEPVQVRHEPFKVNVLQHSDYLRDPTDRYSPYQLRQPGLANRFTPIHHNLFRTGYFDGSIWLRVPVNNPDGLTRDYLLQVESHANHLIEVFTPTPQGTYRMQRTGASVPLVQRPEPIGNYVIPVEISPGASDLFIRLKTTDSLNTRVWLMDPASLHLKLVSTLSIHSGFLAIQLLMLLACLVAAVNTRQVVFLWLGLANLGVMGLNAGWNGFTSYLLTTVSFADIHSRNLSGMLLIAGLTAVFRQMRKDRQPAWLNRVLFWQTALLVLAGLLTLIPATMAASPALLTITLIVLITLIGLWLLNRDGQAAFEYWLLAGLITLLFVYFLIIAANLGLMRSLTTNAIILHLSSIVAMAFLGWSVWLANRKIHSHLSAEGLNLPRLHWPLLRKLNHEMRGPINGVLGMTELLQDTSLSAHQQEYVNTVQAAGFSLLRQADQLQNLVRIGLNRLPENEEEFDLYDLLEEAIQPYSRLAHAKQLELVMDVAPDLPARYRGNAQVLTQILSNLLDNALSYTENGEVLIQVKPWNNGRLRFSVTDTGPGLPRELKSNLFDFPSARTEQVMTPNQVHLGLPITRILVGLLGGQISFSSEMRMGTTFWIDVPLTPVPVTEVENQQPATNLDQLRLMVVDDNLTCRKVIEHLGMSWGMKVLSMSNGQSALANLHNEFHKGAPIDVLVLDQNMPGMTGSELTERIRTDDALNKNIVIIMLTGVDVGQVDLADHRLNIRYLLTKPVSGRSLKQTLMQAMPEIKANRDKHHVKKSYFF